MKTLVPHYYDKFKCIANRCRHSCCIGWQVDIDDATLAKYKALNTDFGRRIIDSIDTNDDCSCFKLKNGERCPFLNSDNLCDIIINLGEDHLCDICTDHPRFRNFYSDRTEFGLGICCEEACRIILSDTDEFALVCGDDENCELLTDDELLFIAERDKILSVAHSCKNAFNAINMVNSHYGLSPVSFDAAAAMKFYMELELLDPKWHKLLKSLCSDPIFKPDKTADTAFVNLYKYFIFRHLTDEDFYFGLSFAEVSVRLIYALCERHGFDFDGICEIARMYSAEIEYSDENIGKLKSAASISDD